MDENIRYISRMDSDYPEKLKNIPDPPAGIYVKGRLPDDKKKSVAIVGARNCSQYGKSIAEYFASSLASAGVQIISGLARGIDGAAQSAAVKAGGSTFGVLGCGVNVVYPKCNADIYKETLKTGGIISEVSNDEPPLKAYFPLRNRIIAGLCDILLVIEARERSGTGITVRNALEQGKDVFAVPGRLTDSLSAGCNRLIAQGAGIALNPETVLLALSCNDDKEPVICPSCKRKYDSREIGYEKITLVGTEKVVYSLLDLYPKSLDEILMNSDLTLSETLEALFKLMMKGAVSECAKNHYVRKI